MKQVCIATFAAFVSFAPAPVLAEDDGFSLMEEGAQLFLRGLMQEMDPAIRELENLADEMEPAFRDFALVMGPALSRLLDAVDSIAYYDAPEILENGDIIIRRSEDAPPYVPNAGTAAPDGDVDIEL